jgi:hypothetical protein
MIVSRRSFSRRFCFGDFLKDDLQSKSFGWSMDRAEGRLRTDDRFRSDRQEEDAMLFRTLIRPTFRITLALAMFCAATGLDAAKR